MVTGIFTPLPFMFGCEASMSACSASTRFSVLMNSSVRAMPRDAAMISPKPPPMPRRSARNCIDEIEVPSTFELAGVIVSSRTIENSGLHSQSGPKLWPSGVCVQSWLGSSSSFFQSVPQAFLISLSVLTSRLVVSTSIRRISLAVSPNSSRACSLFISSSSGLLGSSLRRSSYSSSSPKPSSPVEPVGSVSSPVLGPALGSVPDAVSVALVTSSPPPHPERGARARASATGSETMSCFMAGK